MPNWEENDLTVTGPAEEVERLKTLLKSDESDFDFNKVIPMPELIKNTSSGSTIFDGVRYTSWYEEKGGYTADGRYYALPAGERPVSRPFTDDEIRELSRIGSENWYDWSIKHWGCKWPACEVEVIDDFNASDGSGHIFYRFETPWGPPTEVLEKLRGMFPDLNFDHESRDIG